MLENRVIRIFGSTRDEVRVGWKKPQNKELHNFYCSNIIKEIKWKRMRWVGHVVCKER
jgi:hypothetical protein